MNKRAIFSHYSAIIDKLIDNSMFFSAYFQAPWYMEEDLLGEEYEELPTSINICNGATRSCIIDNDYDYVVKFDIEEDAFGSACERESGIYRAAKVRSLDCYFNEIEYIGTYTHTYYFYDIEEIQEHCNYLIYEAKKFDEELMAHEEEMTLQSITVSIPLYGCRRAHAYDCGPCDNELVAQAQKVVSPLRGRNICVATAFIRDYGIEEYKRMSEFAIEQQINDLHLSNIGEVEGKFVLLDFSGYHSEEDEEETESWGL